MQGHKRKALLAITTMMLLTVAPLITSNGSSGEGPPTRSEDPVAQWDFREGTGQYIYDRSGNGNDGVRGLTTGSDQSDPEWVEGLHNGAMDFDGMNDFVNCGNGSALQFGRGSFSIEAWANLGGNLTDNNGGILNKFDRSSDRGIFLDVISDHRYGGWGKAYGQVVFGMNDGLLNDTWNTAAGRYGTSTELYDIAVYDGDLYAATSQGDLIQWTPSGWVRKAPVYLSKRVTSLAVYNGKLYGGVNDLGELLEFDGSSWNRVAQMEGSQQISCLAVFNGMLYAGTSPNSKLLEWNGFGAWTEVAGQYSTETQITELCVFNNYLYAATNPGGYLLQWNGRDSWAQKAYLGTPLQALSVFNGKLYSGYSSLYEWNGISTWMSRSDPLSSGSITCLATFNGKLYAGTSSTGQLLEWDGDNSLVQRAPMKDNNHMINSMCTYQGKLFASSSGYGHLLEWSSGWAVSLDEGLQSGWNQIVGVKNVSGRELLLYINGELRARSRGFDPSLYDVNCTKNFLIGHGNQDHFKGLIDRVRIFDSVLSAAQIREDHDFFSMEWRAPMPPAMPGIDPGDLYVNITWDYPISNGTNPLLGFRLYKGLSEEELELYNETDDTVLSFNDSDVAYGVTYYYKVNTFSDAGESDSEEILEATPLGLPTPPINLTVMWGDRFVNMTWKAPLMTKGSNITSYRIERGLDPNEFSDLIILSGDKRYYNDTIVDNRQTYYYRVCARNEVGESPPSNNISAVPKKLAPPVRQLQFIPCDYGADLSWENSTDKWFSHFDLYRGIRELTSGGLMGKYYSNKDMTNLSFENQDHIVDFDWGEGPPIPRMEDNQFSIKWDGYINAEITGSYTINIKADGGIRLWIDNIPLIDQWNDAWYEQLSASIYLLSGEHQIKLHYYNEEGRAAIRLSWAPPDQDSHVIPTTNLFGYYITYELIAQLEENHYSDENLELGSSYYYYVVAVNDAGDSHIGNIIEVYPIGLPDPPRGFDITTGDGYLNLTWLTPADVKGSPIKEYRIFRANGTQNVVFHANVSGDRLYFNDTDIVNGLTYFYYVIAVNDAGPSEPSTSLMETPIGRPSYPRNLKVETYEGGLRVSWAAPKYTGGADMRGFNVYRSVNGGNRTFVYWVNDFLTLGYIDLDVAPGNTYNYWVTTLNEVGESEFSGNASYSIPGTVVPPDDDDDVEPEEEDGKEKGFPVVWVVLGIIALLLVAAVVAFLVIRKRRETRQELMLGPVQVGAGTGVDDTFEIFHPDQIQQGEIMVQPVGQPVTPVVQEFQQQPVDQYPQYDQGGQYPQQDHYPQEGAQDPYYQPAPQYDLPPQNQYYPEQDPQETGYQEQQEYYPQEGTQYYQQQGSEGLEGEYVAPPETETQQEPPPSEDIPPEEDTMKNPFFTDAEEDP